MGKYIKRIKNSREIHGINVVWWTNYVHYKNGLDFLVQVTLGFLVEWTWISIIQHTPDLTRSYNGLVHVYF